MSKLRRSLIAIMVCVLALSAAGLTLGGCDHDHHHHITDVPLPN